MKCIECNSETDRPRFCSKKCGNTSRRKAYALKNTKKTCLKCDELLPNSRSSLCSLHYKEDLDLKRQYLSSLTIQDYLDKESNKNYHSKFSAIRGLARTWNKELTKLPISLP